MDDDGDAHEDAYDHHDELAYKDHGENDEEENNGALEDLHENHGAAVNHSTCDEAEESDDADDGPDDGTEVGHAERKTHDDEDVVADGAHEILSVDVLLQAQIAVQAVGDTPDSFRPEITRPEHLTVV